MEIIIKGKGRILRTRAKKLGWILTVLSRKYRFKLPSELIVRPVKKPATCDCYNNCAVRNCSYGRFGRSPDGTLYVALNVESNLRNGKLMDTVRHEAAHMAVFLMKDPHWKRHHKKWKEIFESAKEVR
jgi:hypothetical protein